MVQSLKQPFKSAANIFSLTNAAEGPSSSVVQQQQQEGGGTDEEKGKSTRVKVPFYSLTQEERIQVFRIKSAKKEKQREKELKERRELLVRI